MVPKQSILGGALDWVTPLDSTTRLTHEDIAEIEAAQRKGKTFAELGDQAPKTPADEIRQFMNQRNSSPADEMRQFLQGQK